MKKKIRAALPLFLLSLLLILCLSACRSLPHDENAEISYTCTLSIRCDTALGKTSEKAEILPEDGVILEEETVSFDEGESVFDVLYRETRDKKIHMEFSETPLYDSVYIEGIGNLYEFDCGALSGWMYKVNGVFPSYGCSKYILCDGDVIEWVYTCDLGEDVGGGGFAGEENTNA